MLIIPDGLHGYKAVVDNNRFTILITSSTKQDLHVSISIIHHTSKGNRTISMSIGEMLLTSQPLSSASLECPKCQDAPGARMFKALECSKCWNV